MTSSSIPNPIYKYKGVNIGCRSYTPERPFPSSRAWCPSRPLDRNAFRQQPGMERTAVTTTTCACWGNADEMHYQLLLPWWYATWQMQHINFLRWPLCLLGYIAHNSGLITSVALNVPILVNTFLPTPSFGRKTPEQALPGGTWWNRTSWCRPGWEGRPTSKTPVKERKPLRVKKALEFSYTLVPTSQDVTEIKQNASNFKTGKGETFK